MQNQIKYLSCIAPQKSSLPILSHVQAKDGILSAIDLEISLQIKTDAKNGVYKIIAKKDLAITDIDIDEFPLLPKNKGTHIFTATLKNLLPAIKNASAFVDNSENRPEIHGSFFKAKGGQVSIVATDSHRLYHKTLRAKVISESQFIVSNIKKLASALPVLGDLVDVFYSESETESSYATFQGENGKIMVRTINGQFPNYPEIYPSFPLRLKLNRKEALTALKELLPYAKECPEPHIEILTNAKFSEMSFVCKNEYEKIDKTVFCSIESCEPAETKLMEPQDGILIMPIKNNEYKKLIINIKYLISAFNALNEDMIYLYQMENPSNSIMLFSEL